MKKLSEFLKKVEWRDPMILILCGLLLFLVVGNGIHGIAEMSEKETVICIDAAFGGSLSGYEGKIDEAEVTGKVADELASLLDQNRANQPGKAGLCSEYSCGWKYEPG